MKTLFSETIQPQDESLLSKIPGKDPDWMLEISLYEQDEQERSIQASWKSEITTEEFFDQATIFYPDEYEEDLTRFDTMGRGRTLMSDLQENKRLVYTEGPGYLTYTGPSDSVDDLKELIEETHSYKESEVEYAVRRLEELVDEHLE